MSVYGTEFLIAAATKSLVLLALTMLLALVVRRRSAAVLHGVWTLGLAACLVVPAVAWLAPRWSAPVLPNWSADATVPPRMHSRTEPTRVALNSDMALAQPLASKPEPLAPIAATPLATTDGPLVVEASAGTSDWLAIDRRRRRVGPRRGARLAAIARRKPGCASAGASSADNRG